MNALRPHPALTGALNDYACGMEEAMGAWLRAPGVADALHVDPLGAQGGMQYDANVGDITGTYEKLLGKYRLLIYSGDVDACVPYWGTERFTRAIGGEEQGEWHAWTSESVAGKGRVVAGYATTYKDFQFITVKGAGHEVPRYRPVAALTMLRKFLKNETF